MKMLKVLVKIFIKIFSNLYNIVLFLRFIFNLLELGRGLSACEFGFS